LLLVPVLAGCGEPVFIPEAGPGAPGYSERPAPPPPEVQVAHVAAGKPLPAGGYIDRVTRQDGTFLVTGWALIGLDTPRGLLKLVLPEGVDGELEDVVTLPRPDVVAATGNVELLWAGFAFTVRGVLPEDEGICLLSRGPMGAFRLDGSDARLCPAKES
jgi:hypothetical protein